MKTINKKAIAEIIKAAQKWQVLNPNKLTTVSN
uniref:Uncharacterized protein n=1 Tax=Erwinia amylovora ATCC BAA-2158 TaxID=889211 RepID=E5B874_ERWAM|nr:hypothetical protein predicted by Glimmer/Critica [Erwinia amylovora ATCC BAA-2158]